MQAKTVENASFLVISTMKDEGPYILEWIAWYQTLGFSDFLVYTNDCSDGTDLILRRLEQLKLAEHEDNQVLRRGPHKSALKYAFSHATFQKSDWAFVCDVDEYLNIHRGTGRIQDLVGAYPDADAIPIVWRMFSAAGNAEIIEPMLTETLIDAAPYSGRDGKPGRGYIKTMFRCDERIEKLGLHRPYYKENSVQKWMPQQPPENDKLRLVGNLGQDVAQLNHYAVRSAKSFLIKRDRGRANHTSQTLGLDYWQRWNTGGETDRSMLRLNEEHKSNLEKLLQDPLLRALHEAAVQIHNARVLALLSADEKTRKIYDEIVSEKADGFVNRNESSASNSTSYEVHQSVPDQPVLKMATTDEATTIIQNILTKSDKLRRAPNRRKLRQKMLDEVMPKGGRCAEIGVWEGDFSAEILNFTQPRELVLIDPWDLLAPMSEDHTHSQHSSATLMRQKYEQVTSILGRLQNCVVRKGFSAEVLETYPDNYFDWVYIDGNHMYDFVLQDILVSARKVRPGGIIAGDDLFWKRDERMHVREAMREALQQLGGEFQQTRRGAQFIIRKQAN